jgi:hypothetical protein
MSINFEDVADMNVKLDSLIQRNTEILTAVVDDEVVMMSADQGQYFGLSAVGAHIWELAEKPTLVSELVETLCQKYDISFEECESDTLIFLNSMVAAGLIKVFR